MPRPKDSRLKYNSRRERNYPMKKSEKHFSGAWSTASWHEKDLGAEKTPLSYSC